jgi:chemotaxis protein MotB
MVDAAGELPNTQPHAPPGGGSAAVHFVDAPVFPQAAEANPGPAETARTATAAREIAKPETPNPATETAAIGDLLKSRGDAIVAREGDRITTLQISSAAFFGSGYATLSLPGKSILRDVAVTLKSPEFAAYRISIEGHTDDSPISTSQFQSNWELSTARAAAVVRFFLEQGIPPWKLTAAGYADTFPIAPNRNVDGTVIPDNQAKNRRVVIRLEKIDKARE